MMIRIRINNFGIDYDRDYGIDKRSGWSVCLGGSYYVQFARGPIRAVVLAFWRRWKLRDR